MLFEMLLNVNQLMQSNLPVQEITQKWIYLFYLIANCKPHIRIVSSLFRGGGKDPPAMRMRCSHYQFIVFLRFDFFQKSIRLYKVTQPSQLQLLSHRRSQIEVGVKVFNGLEQTDLFGGHQRNSRRKT